MRPQVSLDVDSLRSNVRAWRARAGCSLRAVIKANGYGWGFATVIDAIDDLVDGYYVSDIDEYDEVRLLTEKPLATLLDVSPERAGDVFASGGIPTISSISGIEAAAAWVREHERSARIRIALRMAVGWSGFDASQSRELADALRGMNLDIELSGHITDPSLQEEQTRMFDRVLAELRAAHINVIATDLESTLPLATGDTHGSQVRLGIGMFGAHFGANVSVATAIRLRAPTVETLASTGQYVGYGVTRAPAAGYLTVLRCGYADGFPRIRNGYAGILAVGMQFTTIHTERSIETPDVELIGKSTSLEALAATGGTTVHDLAVALGTAALAKRG